MGRNATRAQQAKARVREARLLLLAERQALASLELAAQGLCPTGDTPGG